MTSVDLAQVEQDVLHALAANQGYVDRCLAEFETARRRRNYPAVAFCGMGRCGKDTAGIYLASGCSVRFKGSISSVIAPLVATSLNLSVDEAFSKRHDNRMYWFEFCNELRQHDLTLLVKMTLAKSDIVGGIRAASELFECSRTGVIDLSVWVENDRVDTDPTVEYTADDCDIVVRNCGTLSEYYGKLRRLAGTLNLPIRNENEASDGKDQHKRTLQELKNYRDDNTVASSG